MPEDKTTSLIESALGDAGIDISGGNDSVGDVVETPEATTTEEPTEVTAENSTESTDKTASATKTEATAEKKVEPKTDEIDRLLESEGFKGGKDNRIPYSRTKKIIENTLKKRGEEYTSQLTERDTKIQTYERRIEGYNRADQLFANDPDRALQMLAVMHPGKYDKFLQNAVAKTPERAAVKPVVDENGPKPQPDLKFDDGTVGYSPEQHDRLLEWNTAKAVSAAVAATKTEYDKRFGPIEKNWQQTAVDQQRLQSIRATTDRARQIYGADFFKENESEIVKALQENERKNAQGLEPLVPLRDMIDRVLVPKLRAEKNKVREEVITEANKRAEAAEKTDTKSTKKPARDPNERADTEDIIREAVAAAGWK